MKRLLLSLSVLLLSLGSLLAQDNSKGYYKDIYMDGGVRLTSKKDLPAARYLGLSLEKLTSALRVDLTYLDTLNQNSKIIGNEIDCNGILLYPDGEPRFRLIYVNGGLATQHGRSLTEEGREAIRKFIRNGGSYVGSCAGAFLAGRYLDTVETQIRKEYLDIWPGYGITSGIVDSYTGVKVPKKSPLLKYFDFGGDYFIDSVYHNGGCYASKGEYFPKGTEVLLRFVADTFKLKTPAHDEVLCWAYKSSDQSGRVIPMGSHPENAVYGERLDLMASLILYAMDGNGKASLKGVLTNGRTRVMDKTTEDDDPSYTRIGDKQYHHFAIDVPKAVKSLKVSLGSFKGWSNFDLYLFAGYGGFAYMDNADYRNIKLGVDKAIVIDRPKAGRLYISVFCDTTVDTYEDFYGTQYKGRTDVLNGVPYSLTVEY